MKKFAFAVAAAGLMSLAACQQGGGAENTTATNIAENLEQQADNLETAADNATTENQSEALDSAAENVETAAENVAANATAGNAATANAQ